jgi:hypothetical protein
MPPPGIAAAAVSFFGTSAGPAMVKVGSHAGVKMIKQYLKGSALQTLKQMLRTIGVSFYARQW